MINVTTTGVAMQWLETNAVHLIACAHGLVVLMGGTTVIQAFRLAPFRDASMMTRGPLVACLVAGGQLVLYAESRRAGGELDDWVHLLAVGLAGVEVMGAWWGRSDSRRYALESNASRTLPSRRALDYSLPSAFVGLLWVVGVIAGFVAWFAFVDVIAPRAPDILRASTEEYGVCAPSGACDPSAVYWDLESGGEREVVAEVRQDRSPLRPRSGVTIGLRSNSLGESCDGTVKWTVTSPDGEAERGVLRGTGDGLTKSLSGRFTFTAERVDDHDCDVAVRLAQ